MPDGPQSLEHFAFHDFAGDADLPVIIDFESMRAKSGRAPAAKKSTTHMGEAKPLSLAAFGEIHYQDFPSSLIRRFYNDYPPPKSLPSDLRDLKIRFANDVSRVFKSEADFSNVYSEWPSCSLSLDSIDEPPSPPHLGNLLSLNPSTTWNRVLPQQRGPPYTTLATASQLAALKPIDAAARLQMSELTPTHFGLNEFVQEARTATLYEYRGQGPRSGIWQPEQSRASGRGVMSMSCALDVCIVAGMLLDVGRITADSDTQPTNPHGLQACFLKTCGVDWRALSKNQAALAKDDLYRQVLALRPAVDIESATMGDLSLELMAVSGNLGVWSLCTAGLGQFTFSGQAIKYCIKCNAQDLISLNEPFFTASEVHITKLDYTIDMATLVQRYFNGQILQRGCMVCKNSRVMLGRRILHSEPPLRMAISMNKLYAIKDNPRTWHTLKIPDNFEITYYSRGQSNPQCAKYKWLGGIYYSEAHFRVYWENDSNVNVQEVMQGGSVPEINAARRTQMYDGARSTAPGKVQGLILGGIPCNDISARVPRPWHNGADMLFYERTS
ncbi:MAG: hypothetical protein M1829_001957 [Trizodia sp. TS-e1964]|nr:MAG: hypothetical protein M1829_001957 [Trizodia sp. TS-e1964]